LAIDTEGEQAFSSADGIFVAAVVRDVFAIRLENPPDRRFTELPRRQGVQASRFTKLRNQRSVSISNLLIRIVLQSCATGEH
jgi:hypothetical protein